MSDESKNLPVHKPKPIPVSVRRVETVEHRDDSMLDALAGMVSAFTAFPASIVNADADRHNYASARQQHEQYNRRR